MSQIGKLNSVNKAIYRAILRWTRQKHVRQTPFRLNTQEYFLTSSTPGAAQPLPLLPSYLKQVQIPLLEKAESPTDSLITKGKGKGKVVEGKCSAIDQFSVPIVQFRDGGQYEFPQEFEFIHNSDGVRTVLKHIYRCPNTESNFPISGMNTKSYQSPTSLSQGHATAAGQEYGLFVIRKLNELNNQLKSRYLGHCDALKEARRGEMDWNRVHFDHNRGAQVDIDADVNIDIDSIHLSVGSTQKATPLVADKNNYGGLFRIGEVVEHRAYNYRGVVVGHFITEVDVPAAVAASVVSESESKSEHVVSPLNNDAVHGGGIGAGATAFDDELLPPVGPGTDTPWNHDSTAVGPVSKANAQVLLLLVDTVDYDYQSSRSSGGGERFEFPLTCEEDQIVSHDSSGSNTNSESTSSSSGIQKTLVTVPTAVMKAFDAHATDSNSRLLYAANFRLVTDPLLTRVNNDAIWGYFDSFNPLIPSLDANGGRDVIGTFGRYVPNAELLYQFPLDFYPLLLRFGGRVGASVGQCAGGLVSSIERFQDDTTVVDAAVDTLATMHQTAVEIDTVITSSMGDISRISTADGSGADVEADVRSLLRAVELPVQQSLQQAALVSSSTGIGSSNRSSSSNSSSTDRTCWSPAEILAIKGQNYAHGAFGKAGNSMYPELLTYIGALQVGIVAGIAPKDCTVSALVSKGLLTDAHGSSKSEATKSGILNVNVTDNAFLQYYNQRIALVAHCAKTTSVLHNLHDVTDQLLNFRTQQFDKYYKHLQINEADDAFSTATAAATDVPVSASLEQSRAFAGRQLQRATRNVVYSVGEIVQIRFTPAMKKASTNTSSDSTTITNQESSGSSGAKVLRGVVVGFDTPPLVQTQLVSKSVLYSGKALNSGHDQPFYRVIFDKSDATELYSDSYWNSLSTEMSKHVDTLASNAISSGTGDAVVVDIDAMRNVVHKIPSPSTVLNHLAVCGDILASSLFQPNNTLYCDYSKQPMSDMKEARDRASAGRQAVIYYVPEELLTPALTDKKRGGATLIDPLVHNTAAAGPSTPGAGGYSNTSQLHPLSLYFSHFDPVQGQYAPRLLQRYCFETVVKPVPLACSSGTTTNDSTGGVVPLGIHGGTTTATTTTTATATATATAATTTAATGAAGATHSLAFAYTDAIMARVMKKLIGIFYASNAGMIVTATPTAIDPISQKVNDSITKFNGHQLFRLMQHSNTRAEAGAFETLIW